MASLVSFVQTLSFSGLFTKALDLTTPSERVNIEKSKSLTDGIGTNQANQIWSDSRFLAGTSENLDLAGGLTDAFGSTLTFTSVKMLMVHNRSSVTFFDLTLSGSFLENDMLGGTSPTVILGPNGIFFISSPVDGFAVTGATGDILTIDSGVATISYDIIVVGVATIS